MANEIRFEANMHLIAEKFNRANRAVLWQLRQFHGYNTLDHTYCDPCGRILHVTAEHADRLMEAGKNVYVDVPIHPDCPVEEYRRCR